MAWIILEGVDRSGKSTVAKMYERQGYELVHMSAPDKKYMEEGYVGPSYVDDMLSMYMEYDSKDVVFDRSIYGECVWPHVFGRSPLLSDDDIEALREFEDKNGTTRILMVDGDADSHWQRCVDNSEPLTYKQFMLASRLFSNMAHRYDFMPYELGDLDENTRNKRQDNSAVEEAESQQEGEGKVPVPSDTPDSTGNDTSIDKTSLGKKETKTSEQEKLERANAINSILSKRIVRQKGEAFDKVDEDIRTFLRKQLSLLLGESQSDVLTNEEIVILKTFCQRIKNKQEANND